jgi:hypothetical protein
MPNQSKPCPIKLSKSKKLFGGITKTKSSHWKIAFHTTAAKSQNIKR